MKTRSMIRASRAATFLAVCAALLLPGCASGPDTSSRSRYETPEAAFGDLLAMVRADDTTRTEDILGPAAQDVLGSGDPIADRAARRDFVALYDEAHEVEMTDAGAVLAVGNMQWPMPIPVVQDDRGWYFDTEEGLQELLDRRVGRNELATIQACQAFVDAQREYFSRDRDGDGLFEYAQRIRSSAGARDGLYWATGDGEAPSPLGDLAAEAAREGYDPGRTDDAARPYHGYYFRILTGQGAGASGGAYDYMVGDSMIGGCALVAYPANHGSSGVMTFLVNHDGVVYEKDLGDDTPETAAALSVFDPRGWLPASTN